MREPERFAELLREGEEQEVVPEVSYSLRACRCGAEMRRTRQGPYRWYCDRCGRHERR